MAENIVYREEQTIPEWNREITVVAYERSEIVYRAECSKCGAVWMQAQEAGQKGSLNGLPHAQYSVQSSALAHDCGATRSRGSSVELHGASPPTESDINLSSLDTDSPRTRGRR
jgi:hypothetical protein